MQQNCINKHDVPSFLSYGSQIAADQPYCSDADPPGAVASARVMQTLQGGTRYPLQLRATTEMPQIFDATYAMSASALCSCAMYQLVVRQAVW